MGNVNTDWLTSLYAISMDQFLPKLEDNITNNSALLTAVKEKSIVIIRDGGPNLQVPLMVSANTGVDSYTGYDTIDTSPQKGFIDGTIAKAYYAAPVTISRQEEKENSGKSQVVDLMAGRIMQAEVSLRERLNADLYLDGTGHGGKNLTGFLLMVPAASGAETYMGVASAVTAWKHKYAECASGTIVESGLDNLYYKISDGVDKPDFVIADDSGLKLYEAQNRAAGIGVAYVNAKLADSGFASAAYKGIPIILDQAQTANVFLMLSSKYLGFFYNNESSDFVRPANQLARVSIISADCQLITSNRRRQGRLVATA